MARLTRAARGAAIALVFALLLAAPAAAAAPTPVRTVYALSPFTIPAGQACTFDVEGHPYWGFTAKTVFPNGLIAHSVRAHGAYVNPANGATYLTADNFYVIDDVDPATGIDHVTLDGMAADSFLPGDTGPFGIVGPDPAFYDFVGRITFDYNLNTGVTTNFTWHGTATDICAALS
ncbi:MAG TPA: hypothetical protein VFP19_08405 [Candidatus Limnocylindrales bacterium]|nr:hypothetical protein [Candidatus Limnocylindrales bacterium]